MNKQKDSHKITPKLRFPEFQTASGWEKKTLGSLGTFTGGGTPSKNNLNYWNGKNPWVSSSDISDESIYAIKVNRFISDLAIKESATKIVPKNSILLVSRVGVGKLAVSRDLICTSQDFINITPAKDNLLFLAYTLKTMKDKFLSLNQGMAIKGFTKDDLVNLDVSLPPTPEEQQKIADCLSSLDELIELQEQKLAALKQHKKGLMQQLFPSHNDLQASRIVYPKLRFPQFKDCKGWEVVELGILADRITVRNKTNKISRVLTNSANDGVIDQREYFDKDIANKDNLESYYTIELGDYVYNPRISNLAPVGPISKNRVGIGVMSPLYTVFRFKNAQNDFYEHFFKTNIWHKYLQQNSNHGARHDRMNITSDDFMSMPLPIPSPEEQQAIADCLSSLDSLISEQNQQIGRLKTHKKGLMQQLFPTLQ